MTTLAQSEYCKSENLDPQDPRCARVLMSGKIEKVSALYIVATLNLSQSPCKNTRYIFTKTI